MFKFFRKLKFSRLKKKKPLVLISIPDNKFGSKIILAKKPKNIEDLIISHINK